MKIRTLVLGGVMCGAFAATGSAAAIARAQDQAAAQSAC